MFIFSFTNHSCLYSRPRHPCSVVSHHRAAGNPHTGPQWGRTPGQDHMKLYTSAHHYHPCSLFPYHNATPEAHTAHQRHSWTHGTYKLEKQMCWRKTGLGTFYLIKLTKCLTLKHWTSALTILTWNLQIRIHHHLKLGWQLELWSQCSSCFCSRPLCLGSQLFHHTAWL